MLMSWIHWLAVKKVLVELTWHSIRGSMIAFLERESMCSIAERSRSRIDRLELSDLDV